MLWWARSALAHPTQLRRSPAWIGEHRGLAAQQLERSMIEDKPLILGIGGTPRRGSSSERALVISLKAAEDEGAPASLRRRTASADVYARTATVRSGFASPGRASCLPRHHHFVACLPRIDIWTDKERARLRGRTQNGHTRLPGWNSRRLHRLCWRLAGSWANISRASNDCSFPQRLANAARRDVEHIQRAVRRRGKLHRCGNQTSA